MSSILLLRILGAAITVAASLAAAFVLSMILMAIWPGALVYAAPLLCPEGFADPFVIEHVYSVPGESRRSWSLVCMSGHGALYRPAPNAPWLLGVAILWLPCMAIALAVMAASRVARQKKG